MFIGHDEVTDLLTSLKSKNKKALVYAGFDPTGNSLHIGHLGVISILSRFADEGHDVNVILGTGTAFIGDPTGKNEMRKMISQEEIESNTRGIMNDIMRVLDNPSFIRNDWLRDLNFQQFMKEAGSRIPLNDLLNLSIVKTRLESGAGITLMEAIYPVLQGWDMVVMSRIARDKGLDTVIQVGGADQTGNISMGIHLANRLVDGVDALGALSNLITSPDGVKMGKTAGNAIFLNPELTDDLVFFDSILSIPDSMTDSMIDVLMPSIDKHSDIMLKKKALAIGITGWVRPEGINNVLDIKTRGFDAGSLKTWHASPGQSIVQILKDSQLVPSIGEAKRMIKNKGIKINQETIDDDTLVFNEPIEFILSKGKKHHIKVSIG